MMEFPEYLRKLPDAIPPGKVLVHNRVMSTRRLGSRGFRAWLEDADTAVGLLRCTCGWAPKLGQHFRRPPQDEV